MSGKNQAGTGEPEDTVWIALLLGGKVFRGSPIVSDVTGDLYPNYSRRPRKGNLDDLPEEKRDA